MVRLFSLLASLFATVTVLLMTAGLVIAHFAFVPGPYLQEGFFTVAQGASLRSISSALEKQGFISSRYVFTGLNILKNSSGDMKAGEYLLTPYMTPDDISKLFVSGKVYLHKFTAVEGESIHQICENVAADNKLSGQLPEAWPEGVLLPDTYKFPRGESREAILKRMNKEMQLYLNQAWKNRAPDLPLETPLQALILASIIEKEAALSHERPQVAAVFINRIRKNMAFQSCATVIYAITEGKRKLDRKLLKADLSFVSPYNTYLHNGFPPTPICCPGRAAIDAALHPSKSDDLFFVIDGEGGHQFSPSFQAHNQAIQEAKQNGAYD